MSVILWAAALGGTLINRVLKLAFDWPRPQLFEWQTEYAGFSSFPSGHATTVMVVYLALAYVVVQLNPTRRMRRMTFAIFGTLVILIGLSRFYLGVHYPSDVIAEYAVGFAWAVFSALAVEAVHNEGCRSPRTPAVDGARAAKTNRRCTRVDRSS